MKRIFWLPLVSAVFGCVLIVIGLVSQKIVSTLIREQVLQNLPLLNGSLAVTKWSTTALPAFAKFTFFNIQNVNEMLESKKAILKESGPFVFRVYYKKKPIKWSENESFLSFETEKTYFFDPELSAGSLDENITVINLPLIYFVNILMEKAKQAKFEEIARRLANGVIQQFNEKLYVTKTVGELLFDGYEPKFAANLISAKLPFKVAENTNQKKFGFMVGRNNTSDGVWTVFTGKHEIEKLGKIYSWNGLKEIRCWNSSICNEMRGTDGTMFPPFLSRDNPLHVFVPFLNRSIHFNFDSKSEVHGLNTFKYRLPTDLFNSLNCYCENDADICGLKGVYDLSKCNFGLPLLISMPHFLDGDSRLFNAIDGLKPSESIHESILHIDPILGLVYSGVSRLQMNVHFKQSYNISSLKHYKTGVYPFLWVEEGASIDEEMANEIKMQFAGKLGTIDMALFYIIFIGAAFVFFAFFCICFEILRKDKIIATKNGLESTNKELNGNVKKSEIDALLKNDKPSHETCL